MVGVCKLTIYEAHIGEGIVDEGSVIEVAVLEECRLDDHHRGGNPAGTPQNMSNNRYATGE